MSDFSARKLRTLTPALSQREREQSTSKSPLQKILQHKPDVCRPLSQSPHEVRIPVFSVRHVDPHAPAVAGELFLQIAPDPVKHLKLKSVFSDPFALRKINRRVDHLRVMRGNAMIGATREQ